MTRSSHPHKRAPSQARIALRLLPAIIGCAVGVTACADDELDARDTAQAEATAGDGPLYLIASSFSAGDQTETYLVTTPTFDKDTEIDATDGPKLLGGIVPNVVGHAVIVPDSNGPVLLRYELDAADRLEMAQSLSFSGVGLTEIKSFHVYIVSEEKGYVFDPAGARIIVWNPSTMTLADAQIDLAETRRDGWAPNLVFEHSGPRRRGNQLLIPLGWTDQDENSRHASGVVTLDTETDEVVAIVEDERCGESYATIEAPGGDIYFFPPDWSSAQHYFAEDFRPTCVLRVRPGAITFESDYALDLSQLGSGSAAAGAVPDGETGFYFTAVDEALYDDGRNESGAFWRFWHYDFESELARPLESLPVWSGQGYYVNVGGKAFIPYWRETDDGWKTTLYSVEGGSDPEALFSFDANWYGAAKLR
jgi:hypothetical protein